MGRILTRQRQEIASSGSRIDRSHPIARRVLWAWDFASGNLKNICGDARADLIYRYRNTSTVARSRSNGIYMYADHGGSDDDTFWTRSDALPFHKGDHIGWIVCAFTTRHYTAFDCGLLAGNSLLSVIHNSSNGLLKAGYVGGNGYSYIKKSATSEYPANEPVYLAMNLRAGDGLTAFANGKELTIVDVGVPSYVGGGTWPSTGHYEIVASSYSNYYRLRCELHFFARGIGDISDEWCRRLSIDPYQFLKPANDRVFLYAVGGAGISGTGALSSSDASVTGTGTVTRTGTGTFSANASAVSGTGVVTRTGTGALADSAATVAGAGVITRVGSGALTDSAALITGAGSVGPASGETGTGVLVAGDSAVAGSGVVGRVGAGALICGAIAISGTGTITRVGTGVLIAGDSVITGQDVPSLSGVMDIERYDPADLPVEYDAVAIMEEFRRVGALLEALMDGYREVKYKEPDRVREGMIVLADGLNWNPGSGAGYYMRLLGTWVKL